jgi:hypothetical protein
VLSTQEMDQANQRNTIVLKLPNTKPLTFWTGKNAYRGPILMDCKLQRTWTGEYNLCVPPCLRGREPRPFKNKRLAQGMFSRPRCSHLPNRLRCHRQLRLRGSAR